MTFQLGKGCHSISGCPPPAPPGYILEMNGYPAGPESSLQNKTKLRNVRMIINPHDSCYQRYLSGFNLFLVSAFFAQKGNVPDIADA